MDKEKYTEVTPDDLSELESELEKTNKAPALDELAEKVAFKKTASLLSHEVKKYDPYSKYEANDLIYKEYNEPLTVSSKGAELFKGAVVLKVVNKIPYKSFNCEMLEIDYTGGGIFRKHLEYMRKTKTQVLLPSSLDGKALTPEVLSREEDPRLTELPLTEKDLKDLKKNLRAALARSDKFFSWGERWQLEKKRVQIGEEKIKTIEDHLFQTRQSTAAKDLARQIFGISDDDDLFDLHCLSLNYVLDAKYKKDFVFVSPEDGGKWILKKTLDSFLENIPLCAAKAKLPVFEEEELAAEEKQPCDFPLKVYLTWREILSGGIRVPEALKRELSSSREYTLIDLDEGKDYTVYYYSVQSIILGLKEFYEKNNVPQGASLTLGKKDPTHLFCTLKKAKKKLGVPTVTYDPKEDLFSAGEEAFTYSLPNKIIHLESETLNSLFSLYSQRDDLDLRELLILVFKNFGLEGEGLSLHIRRAFHLVNMLKQTTLEDVEKTLLNSPYFIESEKKKGLYFYREEQEIEAEPEERPEPLPEAKEAQEKEAADETLPEIGSIGEVTIPEFVAIEEVEEGEKRVETEEELRLQARIEPLREEISREPEKEKVPKKKARKLKPEVEKAPRVRKGERKLIEERIEIEESQQEALFAIKAKEEAAAEERIELPSAEKKPDYKPLEPEKPLSGIFGEKLKSALDKIKREKKKK